MSPEVLIEECFRSGVEISLDGGKLKLRGASKAALKAAMDRLRPHKEEIIKFLTAPKPNDADRNLFERFRFDLCQLDEEPQLVERVTSITLHLVRKCSWSFDEALLAAAEWVVNNPQHPDECGFIDELNRWRSRLVPTDRAAPVILNERGRL